MSMRKTNRLFIYLFTSLFLLSLVIGCNTNKGNIQEGNTIFVAGLHNNGPAYEFDPFKDEIEKTAFAGGKVVLIDTSGLSSKVMDVSIDAPNPNYPTVKINQIVAYNTDQVMNILDSKEGNGNENNTLEALKLAARSVKDSNDNVIILDSGLQTTGSLNFVEGWLYSTETANEIAELVEDDIPDFKGANVTWYYLGDVREPQEALSGSDLKRLRDIWEAILGKSNCSFTFETEVPPANSFTQFGYVTPVEINPQKNTPTLISTTIIDESKLNFVGDKATFIDEEKASEALLEVANILNEYPDNSVYVVGTTATGNNKDFCKGLSEARAQAVVSKLNEFGIENKRMIPIGLGFEDPWHEDDIDQNGRQIEKIAKNNRKVIIIDTKSEEATRLFE